MTRLRKIRLAKLSLIVVAVAGILLTTRDRPWKLERIVYKYGATTLAFGCERVIATNFISSDGTEKRALRMEGKIILTNLSYLVEQRLSGIIIHDNHARALVLNTIQQGEAKKTPGWHWTMLSRKTDVTVLLAKQGVYELDEYACSYFWTDYEKLRKPLPASSPESME